ncbi:hypothetical protein GPJ56_008273 [Histomonas meleagridis]|uniref:uncharacterized protein n=1 Tax=Histomonas meleagridis TaxID=135588 RepID=UPI003559AA61|nr:hypothetical protein GPJ56_008273 [Histomonas meleagridis]KAH0806842.1 hypothetical protein GO595_000018 [Histomonas meleagridis]
MQKGKKKQEENIDDIDPIDVDSPNVDFSVFKNEEEDMAEPPAPVAAPPPPAPKRQNKKKKKDDNFDEESEYSALLQIASENKKREAEANAAKSDSNEFDMRSLNFISELKTIIGATTFDACLKLPKSASDIRFISKLKKWPNRIPQFYHLEPQNNDFLVQLTEYGEQQTSVYTALSRINDAQGLLQLALSSPFSPPLLPIVCQTKLFDRDFEYATEIALRGLYILQQSLPQTFVPGKSKLLPSNGRDQFLDLIAFIARFAFRRSCFKSSLSLWKFGLMITDDDPRNFLLLSAIPALYAGDQKFIQDMLDSDIKWRGIPIRFIPDYGIVNALLKLPNDITALANEMAKWPFFFEDVGMTTEFVPTQFLSTLGSAMRRRIAKFLENPELESVLETAATIAIDLDMKNKIEVELQHWNNVQTDDVEAADFVEEFVMPTG